MWKSIVGFILLAISYKYFFFIRNILKFNHKCILITGGAGELGRQLTELFSQNKNTKIILVDVNEEYLKQTKELFSNNKNIITYKCDITSPEKIQKMLNELGEKYNIDTLINNAGIVSNKSLLELTNTDITSTLNVNILAAILMTKYILPTMIKNQRGHIINIASVAGLMGVPNLTDYCASKFALVGFHSSIRHELAEYKNIHCTCICPYFFKSNLFDGTKGYPWPVNIAITIFTSKEVAFKIYTDIKNLKEMCIYPDILGHLYRIRYLFPTFILDSFIQMGSK